MLTKEQAKIATEVKRSGSFKDFILKLFSASFPEKDIPEAGILSFRGGRHVNWTAAFLQNNPWTMRVSAKNHFKSMSLYALLMWDMFTNHYKGIDCHYFSFQDQMAGWHLKNLKRLIALNPYFKEWDDCKPTAETVLDYTLGADEYGDEHHFTVTGHGILAFKRGLHCARVYADDLLHDPAQRLDPAVIKKINYTVKTQLIDIPTQPAPFSWLHIVGTAQTHFDFYFDKALQKRFSVKVMPAIIQERTGNKEPEVLWPEWRGYEELIRMRVERGPHLFNQEYMCSPVHSENTWFSREDIDRCIIKEREDLAGIPFSPNEHIVTGGWDLGKKHHPGHAGIFEEINGAAYMRWERWFDHVDYTQQLREITAAGRHFKIDALWFDNTRGDLTIAEEQGQLPSWMVPKVETRNSKFVTAQLLDARVHSDPPKIWLFNNRRTIEQILLVDSDLNCMVTPDGHGDSFVSTRMALGAMEGFSGKATANKLYWIG